MRGAASAVGPGPVSSRSEAARQLGNLSGLDCRRCVTHRTGLPARARRFDSIAGDEDDGTSDAAGLARLVDATFALPSDSARRHTLKHERKLPPLSKTSRNRSFVGRSARVVDRPDVARL